jgi:hypothetical protein
MRGIERVEVHLADGVDDKPREMPRREPLADVGRHQKRLLAITRDEALAHPEMVLNPPDDTADLRDSLTRKRKRTRTPVSAGRVRGTPTVPPPWPFVAFVSAPA